MTLLAMSSGDRAMAMMIRCLSFTTDRGKLRHRSFLLLQRKAAFSVRLPSSWNKLPMEIVNSPTLDTFKRLMDLARFSLFPTLP